jgi:hypothetical protein
LFVCCSFFCSPRVAFNQSRSSAFLPNFSLSTLSRIAAFDESLKYFRLFGFACACLAVCALAPTRPRLPVSDSDDTQQLKAVLEHACVRRYEAVVDGTDMEN